MISTTVRPLEDYDIRFDNSCRVFVGGAYPSVFDLQYLQQNIFIIPVSFGKEHKARLAHTDELMEYRQGYVAIHPRHNKLITALRTAIEKGEGSIR